MILLQDKVVEVPDNESISLITISALAPKIYCLEPGKEMVSIFNN